MNTEKAELETLVSVLKRLEDDGFITQFKATEEGLSSLATGEVFQPDDIKVQSFYRFEGESNPDDNAIVYAIETRNGEKGTLIDSYSSYNDDNISEFIKRVQDINKIVD